MRKNAYCALRVGNSWNLIFNESILMILDASVLGDFSYSIDFAEIDNPVYEEHWTHETHDYIQSKVFFRMPEELLEWYCFITDFNPAIDPYVNYCESRPWKIRIYANKLLTWVSYLYICSDSALNDETVYEMLKEVPRYKSILNQPYDFDIPSEKFSPIYQPHDEYIETLRHDLIETLLFLIGKLNQIALNRKTFYISSI